MNRFILKLLQRWADQVALRQVEIYRERWESSLVKQEQQASTIELLRGEIEFQVAWRDRELSRLELESAIFRGRKVLATESPNGTQD